MTVAVAERSFTLPLYEGMHCVACVGRVEQLRLRRWTACDEAAVNLADETLTVRADPQS